MWHKIGQCLKSFLLQFLGCVFVGLLFNVSYAESDMLSTLASGVSSSSASSSYSHYLETSLGSLANIIQYIAIVMGICMILSSLFLFKKYGQMRTFMSQQLTMTRPLLTQIGGAALLILPTFIGTAERMVWGQSWFSQTMSLDLGTDWTGLLEPVFMLVRLLGVIALIRGILLATKAGGQQAQPGMASKAAIHFIAGIISINVDATARILGNIFDFSSIF